MRIAAALASAALLVALKVTSSPVPPHVVQPARLNAKTTAVVTPTWTTYHLNNARDANDATEGSVNSITPAWTATLTGGSTSLDGAVFASPLVYGSSVYVATENNTVYAFDTTTGAEQWSVHMGAPEPGGDLPCGNIDPVGVTGTPVIDPAADGGNGMLFMVGMTAQTVNTPTHYRLFGTDLVTHAVVVDAVVDAGDVRVQGQRGALAISGGYVYVPYGGRAGDCSDNIAPFSPYYGIVQAARESDGVGVYGFQTPGTTQAGIWAPGGESIDGSGNVYVATGNGSGPATESVFKLSPALGVLNQWIAPNQASLDSTDTDVGSISPALVGGGDVYQNGKYGHGFLLSPSLSQLTASPGLVDCGGVTSDASFGATAYAAPYIYVPCTNGLFAVQQSGSTITNSWHMLSSFVGPPIVAGGNVWTMSGSSLYGFNVTTGQQIANVGVGSFSHFQSPAAGGGKIFVAGDNFLKAFTFVHGCSGAGLTAVPAATQSDGLGVAFTATSSGVACTSPVYEYWLQYPNGTWVMTRAFSATATWSWDTTGYPLGSYLIHVWANQSGDSQVTYEALASLSYTLTGCTGATMSPPAGSSFAAGGTVAFTAGSSGCPTPEFEFWVLAPGSSWAMEQAYSPSPTFNWNTNGLAPGGYQVVAWVRQHGDGTATYDAGAGGNYTLTSPGACTSATMSPPAVSSFAVTSTVAFTGGAGGCPNPEFEFWTLAPGSSWMLAKAYSASPSFSWNTMGLAPGGYQVVVWVRQHGSSTATYEAGAGGAYTLTGCTSATLSPPAGSSVAVTTTVAFTAGAGGCSTPEFEFWTLAPGSYWKMGNAYSTSPSFSWNTNGLAPGVYQVVVWVRQQGSGTATYDRGAGGNYTLTGCASATMSPAAPATFAAGSTVSFTAGAGGCANPEFEFWVLAPGSYWKMAQPYGPSPSFSWNTTGLAKGSYQVVVWVRQHGSGTATYDVGAGGSYTLN